MPPSKSACGRPCEPRVVWSVFHGGGAWGGWHKEMRGRVPGPRGWRVAGGSLTMVTRTLRRVGKRGCSRTRPLLCHTHMHPGRAGRCMPEMERPVKMTMIAREPRCAYAHVDDDAPAAPMRRCPSQNGGGRIWRGGAKRKGQRDLPANRLRVANHAEVPLRSRHGHCTREGLISSIVEHAFPFFDAPL